MFLSSEENSGGILSLWSKSNSNILFSYTGDSFVGVCFEWGMMKTMNFVVNVYSKCHLMENKRL